MDPRSRFDPVDRIARCADSAVAVASSIDSLADLERPNAAARSFGFAEEDHHPLRPAPAADPQSNRFNDLLSAAHFRMFPPHLFPPVLSQPYILRAGATVALTGSTPWKARVLDWVVPKGQAFTVQEAHLRVSAGFVAAEAGFIVSKGNAVFFDGSRLKTKHPDGAESIQPPIGPITASEPAALFTTPWTATFQGGDKIGLDLTCEHAGALTLTIALHLRGYLYPTENQR